MGVVLAGLARIIHELSGRAAVEHLRQWITPGEVTDRRQLIEGAHQVGAIHRDCPWWMAVMFAALPRVAEADEGKHGGLPLHDEQSIRANDAPDCGGYLPAQDHGAPHRSLVNNPG